MNNIEEIRCKKILITGGAGFLGSTLAKRLINLGAEVNILIKKETDISRLEKIKEKIKIIYGDLTIKEDLKEVIKEKDFLFHLAWQTDLKKSNADPQKDISQDLIGLINILESCRENNPKIKIIFSSTVTVVGDINEIPVDESHSEKPISIYDVNKFAGEKYLYNYYKNYGIRFCVLRLSNVFGENQKIDSPSRGILNFMIGKAIRGEPLTVYGKGDFIRDYSYSEDYINAFILSAISKNTDGEMFVLGSEQGRTFNSVVEAIKKIGEEIMKKEIIITHIEPPNQQKGEEKINNRNFIANSTKFKKATGWFSKTNFEEGVKKTFEHHYGKFLSENFLGEKKNFLITGGLGHVGSALIREYAKRQDINLIRILDNLSTQRYCSLFEIPKTNVKIEFVEGDINNLELLKNSMKNIDVVIHLAAITNAPETIKKPEETRQVNLIGTQNVLNCAIETGVKKFIFPSSTSVYGEAENVVDEKTIIEDLKPSSPYAEYKLQAEKIVQEANGKNNIQTFVLRKGTIFGKSIGMRFHTAVNNFVWLACINKPLTVWDSAINSKRPYLGLNDAIRAYEFVEKFGKSGEIYNVLTKNYTIMEIVEAIKKFKPELKIEITKSPLLNQKSYEVSCEKFKQLGFEFQDDLEKFLGEEIKLLESVENE